MRIDPGHCGEKARIRDTERTGSSIVVGDVLQEPLDCVVGVGSLIYAFRIRRVAQRPLHDELALTPIPPTYILKDEDVAILPEEPVIIADHGVSRDSVRGSREEKGQRRLAGSRFADAGVERHAVPHRDLHKAAAIGDRRRTLSPARYIAQDHCCCQDEYEVPRQAGLQIGFTAVHSISAIAQTGR